MKKIILLFLALASQVNIAQSIFPTNGESVGIGTTNPLAKLEVNNGSILVRNSSNITNESSIMIAQSINGGNISTFGTSIRTITQNAGGNMYGLQFFTQESYLTNQTEKMRILGNGNVGIGTVGPTSKLESYNAIPGISSFKSVGTNGYIIIDNVGSGENYYNANKFQDFQINNVSKMRISLDGNVGIGTQTPGALLDVYSPIPNPGTYNTQKWSSSNPEYNLKLQTIWNNNGVNQEFIQRFNGVDYKSLVFFGGNVGIGLSNPANKLDVNGTIHSKEVKVDMLGWSDFVFKKGYSLPTLEEVEKHIAEKGHLENIPSEEEVLKNGINLGEMNAKLLQKIEELTLYMIEIKKENMEMKKRIEKIEKK
jgi:hypothetical protein